jgi:hypothetical protein
MSINEPFEDVYNGHATTFSAPVWANLPPPVRAAIGAAFQSLPELSAQGKTLVFDAPPDQSTTTEVQPLATSSHGE